MLDNKVQPKKELQRIQLGITVKHSGGDVIMWAQKPKTDRHTDYK